ncbi:protein ENHANCED DISEASE RESISTANCE 2 [Citrus sinensis]|nr:protein ENHANCED DISEASE RESISTANCE 2 [Citrus sinensis]
MCVIGVEMTMGIMVREDENCGPQPGWRIRHFPIKNLEMVGPEHRSPRMVCQTDEMSAHPRIPVMVNMASASVSSYKNQNLQDSSIHLSSSLDQLIAAGRHSVMMDEYSEEDEEFQLAESEQEANEKKIENDFKRTALEEEQAGQFDLSCFSGNLRHDDRDNAHDCRKLSDGNNFRVRSKHFCYDKTKGSWIVHQSVGSTPCLLGKAVDRNYIRGPKYLEIDVDICSSTIANGVLAFVIGVITTVVVDVASLVQNGKTPPLSLLHLTL